MLAGRVVGDLVLVLRHRALSRRRFRRRAPLHLVVPHARVVLALELALVRMRALALSADDREDARRAARAALELERRDGQLEVAVREVAHVGQLDDVGRVLRGQELLDGVLRLPAELDVDALGGEAGDPPRGQQPLHGLGREAWK